QVHLDGGQRGDLERVAQRPRVVRPRAGVEHDRVRLTAERVQALHKEALVVGVKEARAQAQLARICLDAPLELGQRERAVERGVAGPEVVDVDAVPPLPAPRLAIHRRSSATAPSTSLAATSRSTATSPGARTSTKGT